MKPGEIGITLDFETCRTCHHVCVINDGTVGVCEKFYPCLQGREMLTYRKDGWPLLEDLTVIGSKLYCKHYKPRSRT